MSAPEHSMYAVAAPMRMGAPPARVDGAHGTPSNLSSAFVAKRGRRSSLPLFRTCTTNRPDRRRAASVRDARSRLTSTSGGSVERPMKACVVRPRGGPCPSRGVTVVTPLGNAPASSRNVVRSRGTRPILDGVRMTRFHYAWVVVAITFLALLVTSSVRAAPGVLITPLEREYGWDRAAISAAIAVSILTFGLGGPLSGTLVIRFGPRKVILFGCSLVAVGLLAMLTLHDLWQFFTFWGGIVGMGTGAVGTGHGATVAHRWFRTHRGLILGAFGAATSTGQLLFIPAMAALTVNVGWRAAIELLAVVSLLDLAPVATFMRA